MQKAAVTPYLLGLGVAAVLTVLGAVLAGVGITPWMLWVASLATLTVGLGALLPWALAIAAGLVAPIALAAVAARVLQPVTDDLSLTSVIVLVAMAGSGVALGWVRRRDAELPRVRSEVWGVAPVLLALVTVFVVVSAAGGAASSWAMHNDAVWNTAVARMVIADGGIDQVSNPNPSPATSVLLAAADAVGRANIAASDLLAHDVLRQSQLWLMMAGATVILTAVIVLPRLRNVSLVARLAAAVVITAFPVSWAVLGFSVQFGFYNATLSLVVLLASWIAWERSSPSPLGALAVLSVSIVAMLATWAPLALIPIALVLVILATRGRAWWRGLGRRGAIVLALIALPSPLYAVLVTAPDLMREGAALAVDGAMFPYRPEYLLVAFAVAVLAGCALAAAGFGWHHTLGVVTIIIASGVALGYLVVQRLTSANLWGYYPAKFGWLVFVVIVIVTAAAVPRVVPRVAARGVRAGIALSSAVVLLAIVALLPTPRLGVPFVQMVQQPSGLNMSTVSVGSLFALSAPDDRALVAGYLSPAEDLFINGWLIQTRAEKNSDPARAFAYTLDGTDPAAVCSAATAEGGSITVHTRTSELESQLADCEAVVDVIVD